MILLNRIVSKLSLLSLLMALPVAAPLAAVQDITITFKDLTTSRKVGQDNALYFIKAFSQEISGDLTGDGSKWVSLHTIYKDAHAMMPLPTNQNGIWMNEQGKILYRAPKGKQCSCLFLYDLHNEKHVEIARFHNVRHDTLPPYRLNNKNEIFYFDHSAKEEWIGKIRESTGHISTILDSQKFDALGDPYRLGYSDFLRNFGPDMLKGSSRVDYNDLGQVLFASGTLSHHTWLIDPKHSMTQLWDLPHTVLGMNRSGDIFLHSALSKAGVYHTSKKKLFVFDTKHTSHEYVVSNRLRSAIFPADSLCDPFTGTPLLYLAGDHVRAIEGFEGQKIFFQDMNDRAEGVGFGAISLLAPNFRQGYIKGLVYSVTDGVQELQDFGDRRSAVLGVNSGGALVGFAEGVSGKLQAFLKTSDKMVNLGLLFPDTSLALHINDQEWVLGIYKDDKGLFQGFLYHPKKGVVNIAHGLNDHYTTSFNIPIGFNENGQVVGVLYFLKDNALHRTAFAYDPDSGRAVHLPHYPHVEVNL
jgi:hypothetical protein